MAKDPVCGSEVRSGPIAWLFGLRSTDVEKATRSEYQGKTYHFCSPGCEKAFEEEPARYVT